MEGIRRPRAGQLQKVAHFNGGLFDNPTALPLTGEQIVFLIHAARADWTEVDPAIFGTLLERALDPRERHKFGAHYTPRSYVERTLIEPLRHATRSNAQIQPYSLFQTFPFPDPDEATRERIRELGEKLDSHRKRQQAAHPGLTLTGIYNVLEKLRNAEGASGVGGAKRPAEPSNSEPANAIPNDSPAAKKRPDGENPTKASDGSAGTPRPTASTLEADTEPAYAGILTPKEREIHDDGLVSVLQQIHDDLDQAVFHAYGWDDLHEKLDGPAPSGPKLPAAGGPDPEGAESTTKAAATGEATADTAVRPPTRKEIREQVEAELLERLVALNHARAEEEKQGHIRWLRPDSQNPGGESGPKPQQGELKIPGGRTAVSAEASATPTRKAAKQKWPTDLPAQVAAVQAALPDTGDDPATLSARFGRKSPKREEQIRQILATLQELGAL